MISITATTGQVADLVREIGSDRVEVAGLMGPGVDPHLFKASERNVEELIDSDAIFYSGLHLEGKLGEVLDTVSDFYARELKSVIKSVTAMIEPLMIVVMGGLVGFIAMSIILPIFKLSQILK